MKKWKSELAQLAVKKSDLPTSSAIEDSSNHIPSFLFVFINRPPLFLAFSTGSLPDKHANQTNGSGKTFHQTRQVPNLRCHCGSFPRQLPPLLSESASHLSLLSLPLPTPVRLPLSFNSLHASVSADQSLSAASPAFQVSGRVFAFNSFLSRLENPSERSL